MTTLEHKLDPGRKAIWLGALRSGRYTQGKRTLADDTAIGTVHCCLGVYVDVCRPSKADRIIGEETSDMSDYAVGADGDAFSQAGGMPNRTGGTVADYLAAMNDGTYATPKSFAEIADWIEVNL